MNRQTIRKLVITVSMLFFPVTLYYFSPALVFNAAFNGIVNGSIIVFALLFIVSVPFGRVFCAYLCPGGGLQECAFAVNHKAPGQGRKNAVKYVIWAVWLSGAVFCYVSRGKIVAVDFLFETDQGVSVHDLPSYIIYYGIVFLILIPAVCCGKRAFCHYFCWMAPFMALGIRLRKFFRLPGLHIKVERKEECIHCGKCSGACPMGLDVKEMVREGSIKSMECIQCGACIDECSRDILSYGMRTGVDVKERGIRNGGGKET